jgi:hypothetical protein
MWPPQQPLRTITPFSPSPINNYLSSPLFPHRYYLAKSELVVLKHSNEYLSGKKKQELTDWWLQYIEDNVDKYLHQKGYDPSCVPFQYLDHPPTSMARLQDNIRIVRKLLSDLGSNKNRHYAPPTQIQLELIDPVRQAVYEKVDSLCNDLKLVLWDQINGYGCRMDFKHITSLNNFAFVDEAFLHLNTIREVISSRDAAGAHNTSPLTTSPPLPHSPPPHAPPPHSPLTTSPLTTPRHAATPRHHILLLFLFLFLLFLFLFYF